MENESKTPWWRPAIKLFFELSGWILTPLILAFFLGRWLDARFGTAPWLFLFTLGAAFLFSNIAIVKKSAEAMKAMELQNKNHERASNTEKQ